MNLKLTVIAASLSFLAACSTTPMNQPDYDAAANKTYKNLENSQEPFTKAVTINEALARAFAYDADGAVKRYEVALQANIAELDTPQLIDLIASTGYTSRSNSPASFSENEQGEESLVSSVSREESIADARLGASISIIDYGIDKLISMISDNDELIAKERLYKVYQNIGKNTIDAFNKARIEALYVPKIQKMVVEVTEELKVIESSRDYKNGAINLHKDHTRLTKLKKGLLEISKDLAISKAKLAALMNTNSPFTVDTNNFQKIDLNKIGSDTSKYELEALKARPELHEEHLKIINASHEAKKQLKSLYPNLTLSLGANYDSNRFAANNGFLDFAVGLNADIFSLLNIPLAKRTGEAKVSLAKARYNALSMTTIVQVKITGISLNSSHDNWYQSRALLKSSNNYLQSALGSNLSNTEIIFIKAQNLRNILDEEFAYAKYNKSYAQFLVTIGQDIFPRNFQGKNIDEIAKNIKINTQRLLIN